MTNFGKGYMFMLAMQIPTQNTIFNRKIAIYRKLNNKNPKYKVIQ